SSRSATKFASSGSDPAGGRADGAPAPARGSTGAPSGAVPVSARTSSGCGARGAPWAAVRSSTGGTGGRVGWAPAGCRRACSPTEPAARVAPPRFRPRGAGPLGPKYGPAGAPSSRAGSASVERREKTGGSGEPEPRPGGSANRIMTWCVSRHPVAAPPATNAAAARTGLGYPRTRASARPPGTRRRRASAQHPRGRPGSEHEFDHEEPADQQEEEQPDEPVEVTVNEALDAGAERVDQTRDQEEARAPAHHARHHEHRERDLEDARREREDLVRNGREARDEDRPEVPAVVERPDALERLRAHAR